MKSCQWLCVKEMTLAPRSSAHNAAVTVSIRIRHLFLFLRLFPIHLQLVVQMSSWRMFLMASARLFGNSHSDVFVPPKRGFVLGVWRTVSVGVHVLATLAETQLRKCGLVHIRRYLDLWRTLSSWMTQGCLLQLLSCDCKELLKCCSAIAESLLCCNEGCFSIVVV